MLQAEAIYKAKGKPNQTAKSEILVLALAVDELQIVMIEDGKETVIGTTKGPVKTVTTVVGKKISLKGRLAPKPGNLTEPLWTIPGEIVKSYRTSQLEGVPVQLKQGDLAKDAIDYFWINGGKGRVVSFQAKFEKRLLKAEAKFDVERPIVNTFTAKLTTGTKEPKGTLMKDGVAISNPGFGKGKLELHYGRIDDPGITWMANVTAPPASGGRIGILQLLKGTSKYTDDDAASVTHVRTSGKDFVLDKTVPYTRSIRITAGKAASIPENKKDQSNADSPGSKLVDAEKFVSADDQFEDYLMFRPDGNPDRTIWVTLAKLDWRWQGSAVKKAKGKWVFGDKPVPSALKKNPASMDSTTLPKWEKNWQDDIKYIPPPK